MNLTRKMVGGLVLATALVAGIAFLTYYYTSGMFSDFIAVPISSMEKASITGVKFDAENPNTLLVDVKCLNTYDNRTITFTHAIVKDNLNGEHVLDVDLNNINLKANAEMTVEVVLHSKLPSGKFVVMLVTLAGSSFISPQFTQP